MSNTSSTLEELETLADLLESLGGVDPRRVRLHPPPGEAVEQDVVDLRNGPERRLYELVDGVLVEKAMGFRQSLIAAAMIQFLWTHANERDLGVVAAPDGMMRLAPGLVRIPDVSFVSWSQFPGRRIPDEPIPDLFPDLAVEVLSEGNTAREMNRKIGDYFAAGTRMVWLVDPRRHSVAVYTTPTEVVSVGDDDWLDGGEVVPGFRLNVGELFGEPPVATA